MLKATATVASASPAGGKSASVSWTSSAASGSFAAKLHNAQANPPKIPLSIARPPAPTENQSPNSVSPAAPASSSTAVATAPAPAKKSGLQSSFGNPKSQPKI